jgi:hypothetical protein
MTIICYKDGVLASDSLATAGNFIFGEDDQKIFRHGDVIAAASGVRLTIDRFHQWLDTGPSFKSGDVVPFKADAEDNEINALIVLPDRELFMLYTDGSLESYGRQHGKPLALGIGADFAIGAMLTGLSAPEAVELVCKHWHKVGGKVQIEHAGPANR